MPSYHFDLGNSSEGPLGMCARVKAPSKEKALEILHQALDEEVGDTIEVQTGDDDIQYCHIYLNTKAITVADINDGEEEPD